ncbi:hypothetical protein BGZ52_006879 [Haplosporangium bisporale]|nr:hypothetical protein BGZ52_006879 [Haplosporangium bisporale]
MPHSGHRRDKDSTPTSSSTSSLSFFKKSHNHGHASGYSTPNPKRHSLDSITGVYASPGLSSATPRGNRSNGHQAMSIPMPPPPSLYFSLLPSSAGSHGGSSTGSGSGLSHKNSRDRSKSLSGSKRHLHPHSDPSTPAGASSSSFTPLTPIQSNNSNLHTHVNSNTGLSTASASSSAPSTPFLRSTATPAAGFSHYHTHHHAPRSNLLSSSVAQPSTSAATSIGTYPLSASQSRRSSFETPANGYGEVPDQRQRLGFFDMAIFDPAPDRSKSARSSINVDRSTHDGQSHRMTVSRPPSIESINSSNSVPFAPPPPPPPSAWKKFANHFSKRVIKRHIKFLIALYASSVLALVPQVANVLGPIPYLANVAVVFMHPSRTVGSQLEVTFFSLVGAILAAVWIIPCQLAVAAFNQRYLMEGNNSAWAIDAAWFFIGVWIMTTYKARYAKLNCAFVIYTIIGIFALTRGHQSMEFNIHDFLNLMGPMMVGVAICLIVSIVFWPETASEGLGRAFNESLDTSRALLNLSTRSFLLNHKTIALPKSAIEKAQAEVRTAQKKLYNAYREARYEVTYSMTNPADYKEVRVIISALMRHLGSMSLVVQNERLLMLGHPDRDDEDLLTQSGANSYSGSFMSSCSSSDSDNSDDSDQSGSECDSDCESDSETNVNNNSGDKILHQSDYFGDATAEDAAKKTPHQHRHHRCRHNRRHHNHRSRKQSGDSPTTDDEHGTPRKRVTRRSSAAELRRIRQLLQRAENSTQATMKARQQTQQRQQKEQLEQQRQLHQHLQQVFQNERGGVATAPPTPGGGVHTARSVFSVFAQHRTKADSLRPYGNPSISNRASARTTPMSSRPSSIHEEQNLDTVKSFRSLFSVRSASKTKSKGKSSSRPASLKAGFKTGKHNKKSKKREDTDSEDGPSIPLEQVRFSTIPRMSHDESDDTDHQESIGYHNSKSLLRGIGLRLGPGQHTLSDHLVRKAAEAYRKQKAKELKRERKEAEREAKAEKQRVEKQQQAEAAARAIPPKEVAFGDRKLFMSFLDIVRDPLQRLSDSCSRVMVAMERELVSGLNVEQDRLERIRRRNAQRAAAMRAAELKQAEEEKATIVQGGDATAGAATEAPKDTEASDVTLMNRFRGLIGVKAKGITQEDMEYAEALKKTKLSKADSIHPNKFLQQRTASSGAAGLTSSGLFEDDEDEFLLPAGMSYVQYLTQELEHFDKAEAQGLRDFIATHPTLDVGPREEIFLIFFFLFALREIARELLRLGKYVEELEERERTKLEEEELLKQSSWLYCFGRQSRNGNVNSPPKARKKLWWPKVVGNFWHWFAWGSYTQVKTSEGYNALIRNTTKNLEHRELRTVQEEKVLVEAKNAKTAAEKAAAEAALKQAADKRAEQDNDSKRRQRRHSEGWNMFPLRRAATLAAMVQQSQKSDLEMGLVQGNNRFDDIRPRRSVLKNGSRSNSHGLQHDGEWHFEGKAPRRHRSHEPLSPTLSHASVVEEKQEVKEPTQDLTHLGDPSVLGHQEVLNDSNIEVSAKGKSKRANIYTVSLQQKKSLELQGANDVSQPEALPRANVIQASKTAPPALIYNKEPKSKESRTVISAKSSTHQNRYPSFASSTSPALLPGESSASGSKKPKKKLTRKRFTEDVDDSESTTSESMDIRQRTRLQQQLSASPEPGNKPPVRSIFVNVRKPKTWRYRVWEFLQHFKTEEFKFGFKMAVALTFIGLWSWLQWNSQVLATDRGQWAMLTVMAVLSPTVGATFSVCAMRIAGTLVGTLWALLTYLALPKNPYVICAMMLIIAFAGVFLILETSHPKLGIIMMLSYSSITFIMYEGNTTETIYEVCYKRAVTVIIGIIISVIMNSLLWPILARRELRKEIAYLIGRQGVLFAELVNKFLLEEPQPQNKAPSHYVSNWGDDALSDEYNSEEEEDMEVELKEAARVDPFREGFIERAQQAEKRKRRGTRGSLEHSIQRHHIEDTLESMDPDRLAFQHVEHQLQTKLIKILQLLELSGSEPRLKEEFPMKLYKQIIQCCQNILDRMVSMRMAAQLLSPEVRELVTGPMNYYRRDMVGALLLYFSVLSSSLASKSPLPPYLPSARMARLRVIYNVREAIAAHQAVTGEDHYTYIYYYAFSSALEEVIEELELLAILIKPIVGVTLVSSGENYGCSFGNDQLNLGSAVATSQMGIPALSYHGRPGQEGGSNQPYDHGGIATPGTLQSMVNQAESTAGKGAGAFTNNYQQMRLLQQQEAQQNQYMQQQHIQQLQLHHPHSSLQNQEQKSGFHPELALPAPPRIIINPQIVQMADQSQPAPPFIRTKSKTGSISSGHSSVTSLSRTTADCLVQEKISKHHHHHHQHHQHPHPPPGLKVDTSHVRKDMTSSASPLVGAPVIMMDETLLGGRHAQRYKEAIQVAQEASGQQFIQVSSPVAVLPAQIQLPGPGGVGASSTAQIPRKPSLTGSLHKHPHHHHHPVLSKQQSQEKLREGGRVDNNEAGPSVQPYTINIPAAIVMPFGSEFVPEAPLPLHLVPSRHEQEKEQP